MIVGYKKLESKLDKISKVDMRKGVGKAIQHVQGAAKGNCAFKQATGELRESIYTSLEEDGDAVRGTCYTNKEYAPYVEFGTGPVGQANHQGVSPDVAYAWGQTGWMIPGDAMSREKAERYGLGVVEGKDGKPKGYLTNGQAAQPFLYPALKDHEDEVTDILADQIRRQL